MQHGDHAIQDRLDAIIFNPISDVDAKNMNMNQSAFDYRGSSFVTIVGVQHYTRIISIFKSVKLFCNDGSHMEP
jgi:hypothetical protein